MGSPSAHTRHMYNTHVKSLKNKFAILMRKPAKQHLCMVTMAFLWTDILQNE